MASVYEGRHCHDVEIYSPLVGSSHQMIKTGVSESFLGRACDSIKNGSGQVWLAPHEHLERIKLVGRTVKVRDLVIGDGIPKIAVPLVGRDKEGLRREIDTVSRLPVDLVEWRMDCFSGSENVDEVKKTAGWIRDQIGDLPLLATFRTLNEGGEKESDSKRYLELNIELIRSGSADLVDVELSRGKETVRKINEAAHTSGVKTIVSSHDFSRTPDKETIVRRLCRMQTLGADVTKMAVMPRTSGDVLTLLAATDMMKTQYADRPFITMAMAGKGLISRLTGELFGSAITFGAAAASSAPGQIRADRLKELLNLFHEKMADDGRVAECADRLKH